MLYSVSLGIMTWETARIEADSAEEALKKARELADTSEWDGQQTDAERVECEDSVFNITTNKMDIQARGDKRILDYFDNTRQIAIIWDIDDVKEGRPDLTDEQAMEVLETIKDDHDAYYGVTWYTLRDITDLMFPEDEGKDEEAREE